MGWFKQILTKDSPIVQKYKIFFGISIAVILLGIVFGIVNVFVSGSAFNVGVDFQGGYSMTVEIGDIRLNDDTVDKYRDDIIRVAESSRVDKGDERERERGIKVLSAVRQGSAERAGFLIRYDAVEQLSNEQAADLDTFMTELNDVIKDDLIAFLAPNDEFGIKVESNGQVSATMGAELVSKAMLAVLIALLLMLIYIAIRFDFVSGLATIVGLLHNVAIMIALMAVFRIEINGAFIAALLTLIGYSINNTIVIFDRIRENVRRTQDYTQNMGTGIANRSVRETFTRTINTSITTLIPVLLMVAIGVPDIRLFLWPLIIGFLAGSWSSMFISPTLWAMVINKHADFMIRGAMASNIRNWFVARSAKRKENKSKKQGKKAQAEQV